MKAASVHERIESLRKSAAGNYFYAYMYLIPTIINAAWAYDRKDALAAACAGAFTLVSGGNSVEGFRKHRQADRLEVILAQHVEVEPVPTGPESVADLVPKDIDTQTEDIGSRNLIYDQDSPGLA